jgi:hypothetical protein
MPSASYQEVGSYTHSTLFTLSTLFCVKGLTKGAMVEKKRLYEKKWSLEKETELLEEQIFINSITWALGTIYLIDGRGTLNMLGDMETYPPPPPTIYLYIEYMVPRVYLIYRFKFPMY